PAARGTPARLGADIAAAPRPVVDNKLLAEALRQRLTYQAREDVARTRRSEGHDQMHRPRRIGLRPRDPRYGWQRGSASGELQKFPAGKFHDGCSLRPFPKRWR